MLLRHQEEKAYTIEDAVRKLKNNSTLKRLILINSYINSNRKNNPTLDQQSINLNWQRLSQALKKNLTLESIEIHAINLTSQKEWDKYRTLALGQALKNHPTLRSISIVIKQAVIDETALSNFFYCLSGSAAIEDLFISTNTHSAYLLNFLGLLLYKKNTLKSFSLYGSWNADLEEPLNNFFLGLGAQTQLNSLILHTIDLGNVRIKMLADALKNVTSLKILQLAQCRLGQDKEAKKELQSVCSIITNNPKLEVLGLQNNTLRTPGIKALAHSLPALKNLHALYLMYTGMNNSDLEYLTAYLVKKIRFTDLNISGNHLDAYSISSIKTLITNAPLKKLSLDYSNIRDTASFIKKLKPVLLPPLSQLKEFKFAQVQQYNSETYHQILTILESNPSLTINTSNNCPIVLSIANKVNSAKQNLEEWQMYITTLLCILNGRSNAENSGGISSVPKHILFFILSFIIPNTPHQKENSAFLCFKLIDANLFKRHNLIKSKKYNPVKPQISTWWSKSIEVKNENKTLFFSAHEKRPRIMQWKEIVSEIEMILQLPCSENSEEKEITVELPEKYNIEQYKHIKNIFTLFIEEAPLGHPIPTAKINSEHQLIIRGTTLQMIKNILDFSVLKVTNSSSMCRIS